MANIRNIDLYRPEIIRSMGRFYWRILLGFFLLVLFNFFGELLLPQIYVNWLFNFVGFCLVLYMLLVGFSVTSGNVLPLTRDVHEAIDQALSETKSQTGQKKS